MKHVFSGFCLRLGCVVSLLVAPSVAAAQEAPELSREWTSIEIVLSVGLLIFTLLLIALEAFVVMRATKTWAPRSIVRLIGLTLIICVAALLVVAGYGKDQIAPVTGLLGVVAGYLLGANETKSPA